VWFFLEVFNGFRPDSHDGADDFELSCGWNTMIGIYSWVNSELFQKGIQLLEFLCRERDWNVVWHIRDVVFFCCKFFKKLIFAALLWQIQQAIVSGCIF